MLCLYQLNVLCTIFKSIKKNDMVNFKDFFRKSRYLSLMIFNLLKKVYRKNFFILLIALWKRLAIIISSDRTPMKLDRVQERIKSRLAGGLVVDIDAPDLELKIKIIKKKLSEIESV